MKEYNIVLNLCDEYSIFCDFKFEELTNNVYAELYSKFDNYKFSITDVRVGCETCCNLFGFIKKEKLLDQLRRIRNTKVGISFVFPVVAESNYSLCRDLFLYLLANKAIDSVIVNDYGMLALCREYRVNVILGRIFDKRLRDPRVQSDLFMNGSPENLGVFSQAYLKMYKRESISALELDCLELGIGQDIPEELVTIYLHYPYRYITSGRICEFGGIEKDNYDKFKIDTCSMQCMKFVAKSQTPPLKSVIYKHCNAIFEKVRLTDNIINDFINPKVKVIYTPEFTGRKI